LETLVIREDRNTLYALIEGVGADDNALLKSIGNSLKVGERNYF
jgi:hypothetical protein